MSIALENSASHETIWDFGISTVLGILKIPDLGPIEDMEVSLTITAVQLRVS